MIFVSLVDGLHCHKLGQYEFANSLSSRTSKFALSLW